MLMLLKFNGFPYSQSSNKKARIIHAHAVLEERTKIVLLKGYQTIRERPDCSRVYFCHIELLTFSWPYFFFAYVANKTACTCASAYAYHVQNQVLNSTTKSMYCPWTISLHNAPYVHSPLNSESRVHAGLYLAG